MNPSCKTSNQPSSAPYHLHQAQKPSFSFSRIIYTGQRNPPSNTLSVKPSQFCPLSSSPTLSFAPYHRNLPSNHSNSAPARPSLASNYLSVLPHVVYTGHQNPPSNHPSSISKLRLTSLNLRSPFQAAGNDAL